MQLIGMLDSPYVRRVAVSLEFLGLPFEHSSLSVFRDFDAFARINPVVKAPTLVTDEGVVLMESNLIVDYLDRLAAPEIRLTPAEATDCARSQRLVGLAMAACEKSVQIVYEHNLRPAEKLHQPWLDRVRGQLAAAYGLLEAEVGAGDRWLVGSRPMQADICVAVAWRFTQAMVGGHVAVADHPALARFSARAEALPQFAARPH